jgi:dipeptide/tripeptide permease
VELFERAAYYGTFIALAVFLTDVVGFGDVAAGWIGAVFSSSIYLLPFVTGALSDRLGFRFSLLLAFTLLAAGYGGLALFPTRGAVPFSLALVAVGGAFVKPVITGTVARSSDSASRARAFSIFYMMVNIGSFTGKTVARPVRALLGVGSVPLYSAFAALAALLLTAFLFFPKENGEERPRSVAQSLEGLAVVLRNGRFLALILITAGFWAIQGQLYASMPKYVLRLVGPEASPEWYANVNPLVVVLLVVPVTHLVRRISPVASIGVALGLIPLSALLMSLSGHLAGPVRLFGASLHPVTVLMVAGIALQGLAECFLSPRYLEFASRQAPPARRACTWATPTSTPSSPGSSASPSRATSWRPSARTPKSSPPGGSREKPWPPPTPTLTTSGTPSPAWVSSPSWASSSSPPSPARGEKRKVKSER